MQTSVDDDYLNSLPVEESCRFPDHSEKVRFEEGRYDDAAPSHGKRADGDEKPVIPTELFEANLARPKASL